MCESVEITQLLLMYNYYYGAHVPHGKVLAK
jgi:hypothetical protein